jgi:hypothetical protein
MTTVVIIRDAWHVEVARYNHVRMLTRMESGGVYFLHNTGDRRGTKDEHVTLSPAIRWEIVVPQA